MLKSKSDFSRPRLVAHRRYREIDFVTIVRIEVGHRQGARHLRLGGREHPPRSKVRGCGVGDVKFMLENKSFGGKCGDLNASSLH